MEAVEVTLRKDTARKVRRFLDRAEAEDWILDQERSHGPLQVEILMITTTVKTHDEPATSVVPGEGSYLLDYGTADPWRDDPAKGGRSRG